MFDTHVLNGSGKEAVKAFKEKMYLAIKEVSSVMPDCREKSIFITKIEEGVFFGTKAIASKEGNFDFKISYED